MRQALVLLIALTCACSGTPARTGPPVTPSLDSGAGQALLDAAAADGGALDSGAPPGPPIALASLSLDDVAACGLRASDHTLACWGAPIGETLLMASDGQVQLRAAPPTGQQFSQVSVIDSTACALQLDSSAVCWGYVNGQLGDPPAGRHFAQLTINSVQGCGLDVQGAASCWGSTSYPVATDKLVQISAYGACTCGVRADGEVVCWGVCDSGAVPAPTGQKLSHLALGSGFACGLRPDGSPLCWGSGLDNPGLPPAPADHFVQLSANFAHVCGLRADGTARCWYTPGLHNGVVDAPADEHFSEVHAGGSFACGLRKSDSTPLCWGLNTSHQLEPPTR